MPTPHHKRDPSSARPLFVGAGAGTAACTLYLVAKDPAADLSLVEARRAVPTHKTLSVHPGCLRVVLSERAPSHEAVVRCVDDVQAVMGELSLVVRAERVTPNAWGAASVADADGLLAVIATFAAASTAYNDPPLRLPKRFDASGSLQAHAVEHLKAARSPVAWVLALFVAMRRVQGADGKRWRAALLATLPQLMGRSFALDVLMVDELARVRRVSPGSIETSDAFRAALGAAVGGFNPATSDQAAGLWESPARVSEALSGSTTKLLDRFEASFAEASPVHQRTVLALTAAERLKLCGVGLFFVRLANVATNLMLAGRFADALTVYDAVLEHVGRAERSGHSLPVDPNTMANPLYAVQDDNNHLGVNEARARAYLAVALPYAPRNPLIFLNASGVYAELHDGEKTLEMLHAAKAAGVSIKNYRADKCYAWLRDDPATRQRFNQLMR